MECDQCKLQRDSPVECKICPNIGCDKCMPLCLECEATYCFECEKHHKDFHLEMFDYKHCSQCDQTLDFNYKLWKCKFYLKDEDRCTTYGCRNCFTYCTVCDADLCTRCPDELFRCCSICRDYGCCFDVCPTCGKVICHNCSPEIMKNHNCQKLVQ